MSTTTLNDTTYTSSDIVAHTLGVSTFTATTDISGIGKLWNQGEVEDYILQAEDEINASTGHSWKSTLVTREHHDIDHIYWDGRLYRREIPVKLLHRSLRTFTSGTHKIEYFDGGDWVDLALSANGYSEGRGKDYWIDSEDGIIYMITVRPLYRRKGLRVTYAYGDSDVPRDIQKATTLLACIQLLENELYTNALPEGSDNLTYRDKVEGWKAEVKRILDNRAELIFV